MRYKKCSCGIMVTASHNPPSDNAVKVYWSTGGQILPPHDEGIIERVMNTQEIRRADFDEMLAAGQDRHLPGRGRPEVSRGGADAGVAGAARVEGHLFAAARRRARPRSCRCWRRDGFKNVEVFGPHAKPDGDFPNVPGHVSNPENPQVFDVIIARAQGSGRRPGAGDRSRLRPHRLRRAAHVRQGRAVAHAHRQPDRRALGRLRARELEGGRPAHAAAFHRRNARHDAAHPPHRRQLRRADDRRLARRLQMDRRGDRRIRAGHVHLRHRGVARLHGRHATSATRTARWRRCCCASWPRS